MQQRPKTHLRAGSPRFDPIRAPQIGLSGDLSLEFPSAGQVRLRSHQLTRRRNVRSSRTRPRTRDDRKLCRELSSLPFDAKVLFVALESPMSLTLPSLRIGVRVKDLWPPRRVQRYASVTLRGCLIPIFAGVLLASCSKSGDRASLISYDGPDKQQVDNLTCHAGLEGCACEHSGEQYACGSVKRTDGDFVTCAEGLSTCVDGKWGPCQGDRVVTRSVQSLTLRKGAGVHLMNVTTACTNVCDPFCGLVSSDASDAVGAVGITQGPDGGVTLVSGTGTGTGGSGKLCTGLQCNIQACGGNVKATTLEGRVYDPAGKVPLYNAFVYVPVDPDLTKLPAFSDTWTKGVTCDRCSDTTVRAVAVAQTSTTGAFKLEGVPSGANIPLVVQMGKWRRTIVLSNVTQCQSNSVTNNCTATDKSLCVARLPRNRFDGYNPANQSYSFVSAGGANGIADMPKIAMISGSADPFECMLLKAGIDPNEFGSYDLYPERRIHFYHSPDKPGSKLSATFGNQVNGAVLWNSASNLAKYDLVIPACEGDSIDKLQSSVKPPTGVNPYRNLINYTNAGGRVFTTHYGYVWLQYPYVKSGFSDWRYVANWTHQTGTTTTQTPLPATLVTTFPKGERFADWLMNVSATRTLGSLDLLEGRQDLTTVGASAQGWMTTTNTRNGSVFVPHFTFNTPYGATDANQCGRLVFSDFHVSANALMSSSSCYSADDCGFTASCTNGTAPSIGTCSEPCATDSDCSAGYACTGTVTAGSCTKLSCTTTCSAGVCNAGKCQCTNDGQCGSESCTLTPGSCSAASCTQDSNCGLSEKCSGAKTGTCAADSCTVGSACASNNCVSGKCACTSRTQCSSNACTAAPSTCAAATCNSDNRTCGASETCTLGTTGYCVADSCSSWWDCSTYNCKGTSCGCNKKGDCGGNGRVCNSGVCSVKACNSDSGCAGWEHCQLAGTCGPTTCSSTNPCAAGTCEADGKCHCQNNSQCASNSCTLHTGTCSGTAAACLGDSACGSIEGCTGATSGTCVGKACSATSPCAAGTCVGGVCKCTSAGDCASNSCSGTGSCGAKTCYDNSDCGATEQCSGSTMGTCTKACSVDVDCPNGETCKSGKCTGCTSGTQCQTANYQSSCVGSSGGVKGTCTLFSSTLTFPQSCKRGNLTAQEKALEFMFFDLTACVTPDAYEPSGPVKLFSEASFSPPDYVAACSDGFLPRWREVRWHAKIPSTASITFSAQSGADANSLLPSTPLLVTKATTSTATSATDVAYIDTGVEGGGAFNQDPQTVSDKILRLTITLTPTTDLLSAPVLLDWSVAYDCIEAL